MSPIVLRLRQDAPSWENAKCLGHATGPGNDPWFDNSDDGGLDETEWARDFCNGEDDDFVCPIREECLIFALLNNERFGVWGGTSEVDRRAIRKMWPWPGGNEPHPEWKWYPPGVVAQMLRQRGVENIEEEDDEDPEAPVEAG